MNINPDSLPVDPDKYLPAVTGEPVYLDDSDRQTVLRIASKVTAPHLRVHAWAVANVTARPMMAWLAEADSQADSDRRVAALNRQWHNLLDHQRKAAAAGEDQPDMPYTVDDLLAAARLHHRFLSAGAIAPTARDAIVEALADPPQHYDDAISNWIAQQVAARLARSLAYGDWSYDNAETVVMDVHDEAARRYEDEHLVGGWTISPERAAAAAERINERLWQLTGRTLLPAVTYVTDETTGQAGPVCDNTSVGVIIEDEAGRLLMFDRARFPIGTAPAAGHVDGHGGYEAAARTEVEEELGLTVVELTPAVHWSHPDRRGMWRRNACRWHPGPRGVGHEWKVYHAVVTGELQPSAWETKNTRWIDRYDLPALADRTHAYAKGLISAAEFAASPGIEPVWVRFLVEAELLYLDDLTANDYLTAIDELAARPPAPEANPLPGDASAWLATPWRPRERRSLLQSVVGLIRRRRDQVWAEEAPDSGDKPALRNVARPGPSKERYTGVH